MNLNREFSHASARSHLYRAKSELIGLMAKDKQAQRSVHELKERVEEYERNATQALDIGEESLAREIAETIAMLESRLKWQENENVSFSIQVNRLKDVVHRLERRFDSPDERLQYILDYLEAAAELAEGSDDRELKKKMYAAGIGKQINSGREILARIRTSR